MQRQRYVSSMVDYSMVDYSMVDYSMVDYSMVDYSMVDYSMVQSWIRSCNGDRPHEHKKLPLTARSGREELFTRFIVIQNCCIMQGTTQSRYAALTYTWGTSKQYLLTKARLPILESKNSLARLREHLPLVASGAIMVCQKLKIQYLWIDALCIVRDKPHEKHNQIARTDLIYSSTYLTLVAPTGVDANVGLARVSAPSVRKTKIRNLTVDHVTYVIDEKIRTLLDRSIWSSRGWTLQELVLSTRIPVFTEKEAFFYCSWGLACESKYIPGYQGFVTHPGLGNSQLCNYFAKVHDRYSYMFDSQASQLSHSQTFYMLYYTSLLKEYIKRRLTYESDRPEAFSGLLKAQERTLGPFVWALPCKLLAKALLWDLSVNDYGPAHRLANPVVGLHSDSVYSRIADKVLIDQGVHSATRQIHYSSLRCPGFPSWSWAG
jgi:hypothetical protein